MTNASFFLDTNVLPGRHIGRDVALEAERASHIVCITSDHAGQPHGRSQTMMKTIDDLHDSVVGIEAHGKVTGEDYEKVLMPAVERALVTHEKIRMLYQVAPDFTGFTGGAIWDDARIGLRHLRSFERVAVVTDVRWIADAVKFFQFLIPATTRLFKNDEIDAAKAWLQPASA